MTQQEQKVFQAIDKENTAERTASIQRVLGRVADIDPSRVDGLLFAVKFKDDPDGSADFQVGSVGSPTLLVGILDNAVDKLSESIPSFKEVLSLAAISGLLEQHASELPEDWLKSLEAIWGAPDGDVTEVKSKDETGK
jgi:hypothetical protein